MSDEIGVFYVHVANIPGAYHVGIFYRHFDPAGFVYTVTLEGEPTIRDPGLDASAAEIGTELLLIQNATSPFGPLIGQQGSQIPSGAVVRTLATGDLTAQWLSIVDSFNMMNSGQYAYLPLLQNSNSFVAIALVRAGIVWPMGPFVPEGQPSGSSFNPWIPGSLEPLSVVAPNGVPWSPPDGVTYTFKTYPQLDNSFDVITLFSSPNGPVKSITHVTAGGVITQTAIVSVDGSSTLTKYNLNDKQSWLSQSTKIDQQGNIHLVEVSHGQSGEKRPATINVRTEGPAFAGAVLTDANGNVYGRGSILEMQLKNINLEALGPHEKERLTYKIKKDDFEFVVFSIDGSKLGPRDPKINVYGLFTPQIGGRNIGSYRCPARDPAAPAMLPQKC
jgi:hypothetical protein